MERTQPVKAAFALWWDGRLASCCFVDAANSPFIAWHSKARVTSRCSGLPLWTSVTTAYGPSKRALALTLRRFHPCASSGRSRPAATITYCILVRISPERVCYAAGGPCVTTKTLRLLEPHGAFVQLTPCGQLSSRISVTIECHVRLAFLEVLVPNIALRCDVELVTSSYTHSIRMRDAIGD